MYTQTLDLRDIFPALRFFDGIISDVLGDDPADTLREAEDLADAGKLQEAEEKVMDATGRAMQDIADAEREQREEQEEDLAEAA